MFRWTALWVSVLMFILLLVSVAGTCGNNRGTSPC